MLYAFILMPKNVSLELHIKYSTNTIFLQVHHTVFRGLLPTKYRPFADQEVFSRWQGKAYRSRVSVNVCAQNPSTFCAKKKPRYREIARLDLWLRRQDVNSPLSVLPIQLNHLDGQQPTSVPDAVCCPWTLPRAKKSIRFAVPGRCGVRQSGLASCRPLHCAQIASSATGGAPIAPPLPTAAPSHRTA